MILKAQQSPSPNAKGWFPGMSCSTLSRLLGPRTFYLLSKYQFFLTQCQESACVHKQLLKVVSCNLV